MPRCMRRVHRATRELDREPGPVARGAPLGFHREQSVPEELEWDDADERAYHVLAMEDEGEPIGTGRLKLDCHIGRMAVLRTGGGAASARRSSSRCSSSPKGRLHVVRLHAQTHAIEFYAKHGFRASVGRSSTKPASPTARWSSGSRPSCRRVRSRIRARIAVRLAEQRAPRSDRCAPGRACRRPPHEHHRRRARAVASSG